MSTTITKHIDVDRTPVGGQTPTPDVEQALGNKKAERQAQESPQTVIQSPSLQPESTQDAGVSKVTVTEEIQQ
jgi:hypothetical protein